MRKAFLLFIFSIFIFPALAQQIKQIDLPSSQYIEGLGDGLYKVIRPVFTHEGATLTADSAIRDQKNNKFDAFGHVVITQTDGTVIYSDLLNYYGNTRIALLTNNVRLTDKSGAVLTTNFLTYNMATEIGTYTNGGKIVNGEDVLTSKNGYYFSNSKDAYFRYNVVITSKDAIVKADTMRYNSITQIAYFYGPTTIYGKQDTMYTEDGTYNTVTRQALGVKNNLYQQGSKTLRGDTIRYDDIRGLGRALGNITFNDAGSEKITLKGGYGLYRRADSSTLVTKNAYVILITQDSLKADSIYLTADTLVTRLIEKRTFKPVRRDEAFDETEPGEEQEEAGITNTVRQITLAKPAPATAPAAKEKKQPRIKRADRKNKAATASVPLDSTTAVAKTDSATAKAQVPKYRPKTAAQLADSLRQDSIHRDSVKLSQDTSKTRIVLAYHHVKIFKSDLQAVSDSAFFSYKDSVIRCYRNPIVWSQGAQLTADTIYMQLKNKKLDNMLMQHKGFIVNTEGDSLKFNQVKGKILTGYFKDNRLQRMYVDGNAESNYYTRDSSGYSGMNHSVSSRMKFNFSNSQLEDITFYRKPEMVYNSMSTLSKDNEILPGFIWKPKERPRSREEIIPALAKGPDQNSPAVKPPAPRAKITPPKKQSPKKP